MAEVGPGAGNRLPAAAAAARPPRPPPPPPARFPEHPPGTAEFDTFMGCFTSFLWVIYWSKIMRSLSRLENAQNLAFALILAGLGVLPRLRRAYGRARNPYVFALRVGVAWSPLWASKHVCAAVAPRLSAAPPPLSWALNAMSLLFATRLLAPFMMPLAARLPAAASAAAAAATAAGVYRADQCGCAIFGEPAVRAFIDRMHAVAAAASPLGLAAGAAVPAAPADRCRVAVTAALGALTLTSLLLAKEPRAGAAAWATPADRAVERAGHRLLAWLRGGGGGGWARGGGAAARLAWVPRAWLLASLIWAASTLVVTTLWPLD